MNELLDILQKINPNIDFAHEENLVESGQLDSLDIVSIIDAVQDHLNRTGWKDIDPDNFISATTILEYG